jgi:hypothetical protein
MRTWLLVLVPVLVLTGCTLVVVKGNDNRITDTGKLHGPQVNLQKSPAPEPHGNMQPPDIHH